MNRVSSGLINSNVQQNLRIQESRSNRINNQVGSQQRIQSLREDPLAAGHLVRYESFATRVERFKSNAKTVSDQLSFTEGYITNSIEIMQRVRDLAVTGANGIYNSDDMKNIAVEVDELLKQLVQNANAVSPDGNALFSGTRTHRTAFEVSFGNVEGSSEPLISDVKYNGTNGTTSIEVAENGYLELNNDGSKIFAGDNSRIIAHRDAGAYQVKEDSVIKVDGKEIKLNAGDSVYSVVAKINDAGIAVKAEIDPVTNGLGLVTTDSRMLWLEDKQGTTLYDLGVIKDSSQQPPYNLASTVNATSTSLFDSVIAFRNALLKGDTEAIGSRVLGSLDSALGNLTTQVAKIGSNYERTMQNIARAETDSLNVTSAISHEGDLDMTKAITEMKMLDYVHQASLSTAAKMYDNTLLNHIK